MKQLCCCCTRTSSSSSVSSIQAFKVMARHLRYHATCQSGSSVEGNAKIHKDRGLLATKCKEESKQQTKSHASIRLPFSSWHVPGVEDFAGELLCRDLCSHHSASAATCSVPAIEGSHPLPPSLWWTIKLDQGSSRSHTLYVYACLLLQHKSSLL